MDTRTFSGVPIVKVIRAVRFASGTQDQTLAVDFKW